MGPIAGHHGAMGKPGVEIRGNSAPATGAYCRVSTNHGQTSQNGKIRQSPPMEQASGDEPRIQLVPGVRESGGPGKGEEGLVLCGEDLGGGELER